MPRRFPTALMIRMLAWCGRKRAASGISTRLCWGGSGGTSTILVTPPLHLSLRPLVALSVLLPPPPLPRFGLDAPPSRSVDQLPEVPVGVEVTAQHPFPVRALGEHHRPRPVPEEDARVPVRVVGAARQDLASHDERLLPASGAGHRIRRGKG